MLKRIRTYLPFIVAVAMVLAFSTATMAAKPEAKKSVTFGAFFRSGAGMGSSQIFDLTNSVFKSSDNEYMKNGKFVKLSSYDEVTAQFAAGKVDVVPLFSEQLVDMVERGVPIRYWMTYKQNGKDHTAYCLWSLKSAPIHAYEDIMGKTIVLDTAMPLKLLRLRALLAENGVDRPLWSVFKSFTMVPSSNSAFIAMSLGKADFVWDTIDNDTYLKFMNSTVASNVKHNYCTEAKYARAMMVMNKKYTSDQKFADLTAAFDDIMAKAKQKGPKDPAIQQLNSIFKMLRLEIITANEKLVVEDLALYRKAKTNGWLSEANFIVEHLKKSQPGVTISIKPTFDMCKKMCASDKKKVVACMDACMAEKR